MTRIAILGGTSHIAKTLVMQLAEDADLAFDLYARQPEALQTFVADLGGGSRFEALALDTFGERPWDVCLNAIGAGDPQRIQDLGGEMLRLTERYDDPILHALEHHPERLYIFLSSGAVYGPGLDKPADEDAHLSLTVNRPDLSPYALSKLHAEAKHRALASLNIVDVRVFAYFSRWMDLQGKFFLAELARALKSGETFRTAPADMIRDTVTPEDFATLVRTILKAWTEGPINLALDVYSQAPCGKFELLDAMSEAFDFTYEIDEGFEATAPTGAKPHYASNYRVAETLGYAPTRTSKDGIIKEMKALLD